MYVHVAEGQEGSESHVLRVLIHPTRASGVQEACRKEGCHEAPIHHEDNGQIQNQVTHFVFSWPGKGIADPKPEPDPKVKP